MACAVVSAALAVVAAGRSTALIQKQTSHAHRARMVPEDDDGQEYEYGDLEAHAMDANTADYSIHQFIAPDEARDPMGSDDTEADAAHNDAARSKILSHETFDSEDTPSPDNFLQRSHRRSHRRRMM